MGSSVYAPGSFRKKHGRPQVRNLDDSIASALKARAKAKGVSLDEEVRRTLTASVATDREELVTRAKALHAAAGGKPGKPELDSARTIREERDVSGQPVAQLCYRESCSNRDLVEGVQQ